VSGLPKGWTELTIGEVTLPFTSIDPTKEPSKDYRYIDIGSIDNSRQIITDPKTFKGRDAPSRARRLVLEGDVLFSTVRTYLKNIATVQRELSGALTSTGIAVLRPSALLDGSYLFHWVTSEAFITEISKAQDGTMYPAVSDRDVSSSPIAVPPLAEQRRIVAKLDGLTGSTARAREQLGRIPRLIQKYREAILAGAFSGVLTRNWRDSHCHPEPRTVNLGSVVSDIRYGTAKKCMAVSNGTAVLRIPNVSAGKIDLSELKYAPLEPKELAKLRLEEGDILVVRSNGSVDLVGRPALVTDDAVGMAYAGYLIRLRPDAGIIEPRFLVAMLQSPEIRRVIETGARSTSGVHNINSNELASLQIPLPDPAEQREIVRRVETTLAWLDRVVAEHANASRLLPRLNQAILAKAFRGELVPQDPNAEPDAALQERILAEHAAVTNQNRNPRARDAAEIKLPRKGTPSVARKEDDMNKTRKDVSANYLYDIIKNAGGEMKTDALWRASEMSVDEFYKLLREDVAAGRLKESTDKASITHAR
jgi:type I restriction enzyme S subunit